MVWKVHDCFGVSLFFLRMELFISVLVGRSLAICPRAIVWQSSAIRCKSSCIWYMRSSSIANCCSAHTRSDDIVSAFVVGVDVSFGVVSSSCISSPRKAAIASMSMSRLLISMSSTSSFLVRLSFVCGEPELQEMPCTVCGNMTVGGDCVRE